MKKIILFAILAVTSFSSFAQDQKIVRLVISFYGDSTIFSETYEIDLVRRKVFRITPYVSYLHIKGEKLRTKIRLKKKTGRE